MKTKAAVLGYPNSNNLGDFIQSIAASQWIGSKEVLSIDRDQLHRYNGPKARLLMNGWFMEEPQNWPPSDQIIPLFISFHLNPTAEKGMLSPQGIRYFKMNEPIGCRDLYTQNKLRNHGIQTYFSGCLTLSLKRENFIKKDQERKGILVISPLERLLPQQDTSKKGGLKRLFISTLQLIKQPLKRSKYSKAIKILEAYLSQTDEEIKYCSQLMDPEAHTEKERMHAALTQLKSIAKAKLVVSSRIHSALPAVAFGTPVLFLSDGLEHPNQKSRLQGMESFFMSTTSQELENKQFEIPEPKTISKDILDRFKKEIRAFLKE